MRSPVQFRSAHWIAQSGRASVRCRSSRVQLPLQPLPLTQSCKPGRKPLHRNRSVPMRSTPTFRPKHGIRKQRIRGRGRTCRQDMASSRFTRVRAVTQRQHLHAAHASSAPSPSGAIPSIPPRRHRATRHPDDADCVQGRRNAAPFNAPGRPDPAARTRFFPDRNHQQTQGGSPC